MQHLTVAKFTIIMHDLTLLSSVYSSNSCQGQTRHDNILTLPQAVVFGPCNYYVFYLYGVFKIADRLVIWSSKTNFHGEYNQPTKKEYLSTHTELLYNRLDLVVCDQLDPTSLLTKLMITSPHALQICLVLGNSSGLDRCQSLYSRGCMLVHINKIYSTIFVHQHDILHMSHTNYYHITCISYTDIYNRFHMYTGCQHGS